MANVLTVQGLSRRFGSTVALADADLTVDAGEVVALMGANGAGKSTLVKILTGIHRADGGRIVLSGRVVAPASPREARDLGIGVVHQTIADIGVAALSVLDNLLLDRSTDRGRPVLAGGRRDRAEAAAVAASIALDVPLDAPLGTLSIAERQLVAIARAVACEPKVLIFDEPTASLSTKEAERLFQVVESLKARGVAILYISHKLADLRRLADRVVVLRDGRVAARLTPPIDLSEAVRAMVGRDLAALAPRAASGGAERAAVFRITGARLARSERAFDLDLRVGEVVAVAGPVGAGKSTLAGAIFGLWPLAEGRMELDGATWSPRGPGEAIARGVFVAGEDRWRTSFFPDAVAFASIAGTIGFPFLPRWSRNGLVDRARERRTAGELVRAFGIKARDPQDRLPALSGGNQQKVVLARWHAEPARLLVLDEPFQGVDVGARADIVRAIRAHARDRATLVLVNDVEEAFEVGDRVLAMDRHVVTGALEGFGDPSPQPVSPSTRIPETLP